MAGRSLRSIALDWNSRGITTSRGKPWTNLRLRRVLMNPTYAGLVTYGHQVIGEGEWESLWDKDLHYALVAYLSDDSRRPAASLSASTSGAGSTAAGSAVRRCTCNDDMSGNTSATLPRRFPPGAQRRAAGRLRGRAGVGTAAAQRHSSQADQARGHRRGRAAGSAGRADGSEGPAGQPVDGRHAHREGCAPECELFEQIAAITAVLAEAARTSPAAALLTDGVDRLAEHWTAATADIKGKVINELMTVTVLPVPCDRRGSGCTDPATGKRVIVTEFIRITPR